MQITFLGTSAGVPTRARNVSCVALRLPQRAEVWLFDCGEGTQHQLLRSDIKFSQIKRIFITHLHGDHLFGLPGLLATCGMAGHAESIDIYGPPGLEEYLRECTRRTESQTSYRIGVHTVAAGIIFEDEAYTVSCLPLVHRIQTFGYRIVERDQPGHFDVAKAAAQGIPAGALYGKLKRGERITLSDGREFGGQDFCGPTIKGRRIAYCADTIFCDGAIELARDADVLIHEATFANQDEDLAKRSLHSTAKMAAEVARQAEAKRLLLTHLSPRYAAGQEIVFDDLLAQAQCVFPDTEMARDYLTIEVPRCRVVE